VDRVVRLRDVRDTTVGNLMVPNLDDGWHAAATTDGGSGYGTLRGVVLLAAAPRAWKDPTLEEARPRWPLKDQHGNPLPFELWRRRVWLRLDPDGVTSRDSREIHETNARRDAARAEGR
jgi:hypothetical protein